MSGRGPWHNNSTVPMEGMTPLGMALLDLIAKLAANNESMPNNEPLARQLGCSDAGISRLLLIFERKGVLKIEKRGKTFGLQRRVTIVATNAATAPTLDRIPTRRERERFTYNSHPVPKSPPILEELRVARDRCPMCEMPPHHAECRHGWNGLTTLRQRRDIAAELGLAA